jgi:uroporphyrinogen-III synthase
MTGTLKDIGVLITRPAHQADTLMSLVEAAGGYSFLFPTIEIRPLKNGSLDEILMKLEDYDIAIFVSVNAVTFGFEAIAAHRSSLPANIQVAAVGAATAKALTTRGHAPTIVPADDFRSESLLALDSLQQVQNRKIVIFRGAGGREHLADTLKQRGAVVDYAECYQRILPGADAMNIENAWDAGQIDVVTGTSIDAITNLHDMLSDSGKNMMKTTPMVVISSRMADACRKLGITGEILLAEEASDAAIVAAIETWHRKQKSL